MEITRLSLGGAPLCGTSFALEAAFLDATVGAPVRANAVCDVTEHISTQPEDAQLYKCMGMLTLFLLYTQFRLNHVPYLDISTKRGVRKLGANTLASLLYHVEGRGC